MKKRAVCEGQTELPFATGFGESPDQRPDVGRALVRWQPERREAGCSEPTARHWLMRWWRLSRRNFGLRW